MVLEKIYFPCKYCVYQSLRTADRTERTDYCTVRVSWVEWETVPAVAVIVIW